MGNKRHKPEEIVTNLRQVEVLVGQGMARVDAIRDQSWGIAGRKRQRCGDTSKRRDQQAAAFSEWSHLRSLFRQGHSFAANDNSAAWENRRRAYFLSLNQAALPSVSVWRMIGPTG